MEPVMAEHGELVQNRVSGVMHSVLLASHGLPIWIWRTRCGWRFAKNGSLAYKFAEREEAQKLGNVVKWCEACGLRKELSIPEEISTDDA